jgi:hypothetical protein
LLVEGIEGFEEHDSLLVTWKRANSYGTIVKTSPAAMVKTIIT